ncbi:MAG TPA: hypothetical protein VNQ48_06210 [Microbacteriaceae bacterium]|nr:hypothetical protein [Microbacteriaceae bacterium]
MSDGTDRGEGEAPQPTAARGQWWRSTAAEDPREMGVPIGADGFSYTRKGGEKEGFKLGDALYVSRVRRPVPRGLASGVAGRSVVEEGMGR